MAVAVAVVRGRRCRGCKLDLDPRAAACWFCSTPVEATPSTQAPVAADADEVADDGILFARGVLLGIAAVLVPFGVHLTALSA